MLLISGGRPANLARQSPGAEIACGANFQRNAARRKKIHRAFVAHHADAVADALRAQHFDGLADEFRAANFAGVNQAMHALAGDVFINGAKFAGGKAKFVAADSVGDDVRRAQFRGDPRDFHRRRGAPLAHGVENPLQADPGNLRRGVAQRGKIGGRVLLAAEHHADRKRDLGVQNVLPLHRFGEAPRDQRIILRPAKKRSHPDERFDELREVARSVARGSLFERQRDAVPRGQFHHGRRLDRALQMHVQFGLGQSGAKTEAKECGSRRSSSGHDPARFACGCRRSRSPGQWSAKRRIGSSCHRQPRHQQEAGEDGHDGASGPPGARKARGRPGSR